MNSLTKKFFHYMIPSVAAMWVFSIYTMVDGIFIAKGVGPTAMTAVNLSIPFINSIFAIALLFATGTSTIIAIHLGKGEKDDANQVFTLNSIVMTALGVVLTILAYANVDSIARFLGATAGTHQYVVDYLGTIIVFTVCFILAYSYEVLVKTDGFPFMATFGVIFSALTNVILDYIFIMKFGWGVKGAAFATGLAQLVGALIFIIHFMRKGSNLTFIKPKMDFSIYKRIVPIGFADFIIEFSTAFTIFIFNQAILMVVGENGIVTFTVITYLNTLVVMTMIGINQGMQPLVSFYYGKGEKHSYTHLFHLALKTIGFAGIGFFIMSLIGAKQIVGIFISPDLTELFQGSTHALMLFSISFLVLGFNIVTSGYFSALEKPRYSLTLAILRGFVFVTFSLVIMTILFHSTGIWLTAAVSETLCLLVSLYLYQQYKKNSRTTVNH